MSEQRLLAHDLVGELLANDPISTGVPWLDDLDPESMTQAGRADALRFAERLIAAGAAMKHRFAAAMVAHHADSADPERDNGREWVREEIATALDIDPDAARGVMFEATPMVQQFGATLALLKEGRIKAAHARALVESTAHLDEAQAATVQASVIERLPAQTIANFRRSLRRAVHRIDPASAEEKHARSGADRAMWTRAEENGMASLGASLPAEDASLIATATEAFINQVRRLNPADPRTKAQLRADALTHFALVYLNGRSGSCERRPAVQITIALETLLGLNDNPAELDGYGPIAASLARTIAADPSGTWRRLITDPAGKLLDYEQTRYRPPKSIKNHVRARDRRCRFPRCKRRARQCDIDHRLEWVDHGGTCICNLSACARDIISSNTRRRGSSSEIPSRR